MPADTMRVTVGSTEAGDGFSRVVRLDGREVFYHVAGPGAARPEPSLARGDLLDFALVATIFAAMRAGRPIHVEGPVSHELMRNLEEFQEAWASWRSDLYRVVAVSADEVRRVPDRGHARGVFAFSGGVDGTAALLRHTTPDSGLRRVEPVAAMLIHGLDLPLEAEAAFATAKAGAEDILRPLGVPLCTVRTNWRSICGNWEMEYAAGIVACLHLLADSAEIGVMGACVHYGNLVHPWGSNPVTTPLLSGGAFRLQTEGTAQTRTQKVATLCKRPDIAAHLRVCWQGPATGRNCGRCEKCLRTALNFMANGHLPYCLDAPPSLGQIRGLRTKTRILLKYLKEIHATALANGIDEPWVGALRTAIRTNEALIPLRGVARWTKRYLQT